MKNKIIKGSILVGLGASSYGMLTTFVKMAYREGFSTAEVTFSQFSLGFAALFIITCFRKDRQQQNRKANASCLKHVLQLILAGTTMGVTSICYYQSIRYVSVSVGIVLLMQTVWMGLIAELILRKKMPELRKSIAVCIILGGTVLATNLLQQSLAISWTGFGWGMLAALAYTATMYSSNNIALHFPPQRRSMFMVLGGLIIIILVFYAALHRQLSLDIFLRWGIVLSLFGTVLPPLLLTRGMPLIGMGLGAIIAALEIPVSVFMARLLLHEAVSPVQWIGVLLIVSAVVLMNVGKSKTTATH